MKRNKLFCLAAVLLALSVLVSGCTSSGGNEGAQTQTIAGSTAAVSTVSFKEISKKYDAEDIDSGWDENSATKVALNGSSIAVEGSGASADGGILTIASAGTYILTGSLAGGQIRIAAADTDTVRLVLNGAEITCTDGAPIYASSGDKLIITLADGTLNTVTDGGESFTYAVAADEEPDAAVFSKCDLSINGSGSLTVNAGFNNGIGTKDDLVIADGSYVISAANHAIRGRDSLTVLGGSFEISAGNDGMQSNNDEDASKGWIYLEGGGFNINAANDGIQSETILYITGGEYTISTGGKASSAETSDSYKGIKAAGDMAITGGSFSIDSYDDCIHANGNISVSGGNFTLSSGDDGIHSDADLSVGGGNIDVIKSYEGVEGATLNIGGGSINIVSSDDAINAAGGNDSGMGGKFGRDAFASPGSYYINITGGDIAFTAGGDGIDSNGDITISGGTIIALINSTADNGAIDGDQGTFTVTGGTIIYGGTGTGSAPGGSSTQSYVYTDTGVSAGAQVSAVKDGKTLISFAPEINCQYLAFSSPDITGGESYDIYSGSSLLFSVTAGSGITGGMGGGPGGMGGGPGGMGGGPGGRNGNQ